MYRFLIIIIIFTARIRPELTRSVTHPLLGSVTSLLPFGSCLQCANGNLLCGVRTKCSRRNLLLYLIFLFKYSVLNSPVVSSFLPVSYTHLDVYKRQVGGERDWRLVVPAVLEEKIIWDCHIRYSHFGAKKCVNLLKESCVFRNMER